MAVAKDTSPLCISFAAAFVLSLGGKTMYYLFSFWWIFPLVFLLLMVVCMVLCMRRRCGSRGPCCGGHMRS